MPITGSSLGEAAQNFCDHINFVLSRTVTQTHAVVVPGSDRFQVTFRQAGQLALARLNTRFGPIRLYFGQVCDSVVRNDGLHELYTFQYKYALYPEGGDDPIIRWEYEREPPPGKQSCRHHVQGPVEIHINESTVSLNEIHLPTGYMTFEEVLRFCIVDLGVKPLHEDWDRTLRDSYESFKIDFTK